jgi:DNA-directed RNA polymerase subunit RPC12/RpoP
MGRKPRRDQRSSQTCENCGREYVQRRARQPCPWCGERGTMKGRRTVVPYLSFLARMFPRDQRP